MTTVEHVAKSHMVMNKILFSLEFKTKKGDKRFY